MIIPYRSISPGETLISWDTPSGVVEFSISSGNMIFSCKTTGKMYVKKIADILQDSINSGLILYEEEFEEFAEKDIWKGDYGAKKDGKENS